MDGLSAFNYFLVSENSFDDNIIVAQRTSTWYFSGIEKSYLSRDAIEHLHNRYVLRKCH